MHARHWTRSVAPRIVPVGLALPHVASMVSLGLLAVALAPWLSPALSQVAAADGEPGGRDKAWVDERVEAWRLTPEERSFDRIGWARDLREALRLGKEHRRPVFLFTYDGLSLTAYRC